MKTQYLHQLSNLKQLKEQQAEIRMIIIIIVIFKRYLNKLWNYKFLNHFVYSSFNIAKNNLKHSAKVYL